MIATAETTKTVQEYRVFIKATPQAVWDALTQAEWKKRSPRRARQDSNLRRPA